MSDILTFYMTMQAQSVGIQTDRRTKLRGQITDEKRSWHIFQCS